MAEEEYVQTEYPEPPADMFDVLQRVEREWRAIKEGIEGLSEEELEEPGEGGWSIKDHIAHLHFWEQWVLRHVLRGEPAHEATGVPEQEFRDLDTDGQNDIIFKRNRERAAAEVLSEAWAAHDDMVDALSEIPFQQLMEPRFPDRPDEGPVASSVAGNTYGHYIEHAPQILRLRGLGG